MMKYGYLKSITLTITIIIACFVMTNYFGIGTMRSGTRIGYIGDDGWTSWSARYIMLDGKFKHTIHLKDTQKTIHIQVVTDDGNISIQMKDADKHVIFDEDNIQTSTFDINVSGDVVVQIEAEKHKGSFNISPIESEEQPVK